MDAFSVLRRFVAQSVLHILVDMLGKEWSNWGDELSDAQQNLEENVKGC